MAKYRNGKEIFVLTKNGMGKKHMIQRDISALTKTTGIPHVKVSILIKELGACREDNLAQQLRSHLVSRKGWALCNSNHAKFVCGYLRIFKLRRVSVHRKI